jgi:hypothetical protein
MVDTSDEMKSILNEDEEEKSSWSDVVDSVKEFLSKEKGQERRKKLDSVLGNAAQYFLGPTGLDKKIEGINELINPVVMLEEAGKDVQEGNYLDATVNTALAASPAVISKFAKPAIASITDDIVEAGKSLKETLMGFSYDPSTVGSNLANIKFTKKADDAATTPQNMDLINEELMSVDAYKSSGLGLNKSPPINTKKGYKLFRIDRKTGKLYPLFVDSKTEVPIDEWLTATSGEITVKGKVKSDIGELAYRPGWHAAELPWVNHIGKKHSITKEQYDELVSEGANNVGKETSKDGTVKYFERLRDPDTVWAEVEVANDVDWQTVANNNAKLNKNGKIIPKTAHITTEIPDRGFYFYNTKAGNPNQWIISGQIKVNKVLDDAEVNKINAEEGTLGNDMPRTPYSTSSTTVTRGSTEEFDNMTDEELLDYLGLDDVLAKKDEQMKLKPEDRIKPSGEDALFDFSPSNYAKTTEYVEQTEIYVPRPPKGTNAPLPLNDRSRVLVDNEEIIAQKLAEKMRPLLGTPAQYFYHTGPLLDKAISLGLTKEEAVTWIQDFAQAYAATSPRTKTEPNLLNSSLVLAKEEAGIDVSKIVGPNKDRVVTDKKSKRFGEPELNEKGYPMILGESGIHKKLIDAIQSADGINKNTNTKPYTFAQNVGGNLNGVTVDTHAIRGALMVLEDLGIKVPENFIKPKFRKDYLEGKIDLSDISIIEDKIGKQKINGVEMQTEYAVFSDLYKRAGEILGVSPAEAQALGWFGQGDITNLQSEVKTVLELIDERVDVTAQAMNLDKDTVLTKLLKREIPLLSIFGLGTASIVAKEDQETEELKMAFGGIAEMEKGITTKEGKEMADKSFKLDRRKADTDDDGVVSKEEEVKGEAVQRAVRDREVVEASCGGLMGGYNTLMDHMSPISIAVGMDETTGNPIPPGSNADNVKDDIPAALSSGEYVLPADVVRWHGLKHIQMMMDEAKMGLMSMHYEGQIHDIDEEDKIEESDSESTKDSIPEDEDYTPKKGKQKLQEEIKTPEGNVIELAQVKVEEEKKKA